ncbi:hypothetical protein LCL61_12875 [Amycolatopsis coloradensis]|uniref:Uncharacterized protein n=1 Tax=Amycolatopsis coloradensis TaxID=76021 RepID=A0ACD5BAL4_9PSEU
MGTKVIVSSGETPKNVGSPPTSALTRKWSAASQPETNRLAPVSRYPPSAGSALCCGIRNMLPLLGSESALANRLPPMSSSA